MVSEGVFAFTVAGTASGSPNLSTEQHRLPRYALRHLTSLLLDTSHYSISDLGAVGMLRRGTRQEGPVNAETWRGHGESQEGQQKPCDIAPQQRRNRVIPARSVRFGRLLGRALD